VLLGTSHARRALPGCPVAEPVVACVTSHTDTVAGKKREWTHANSRNEPQAATARQQRFVRCGARSEWRSH
jgi:hypothetical protein